VVSEFWDAEAATFDDEPDHGLADPATRTAWRDLLVGVLPPVPSRVADLGCGTGTLARLLVDEGHQVDGLDLSNAMVARAEAKVPEASFRVGDASDPGLDRAAYDVVLARHVLWAMPEPAAALRRWAALLRPGGRLLLVEGFWSNGAGLTAEQTVALVEGLGRGTELTRLTDPAYWGRETGDERYVVVSRA